MQEKIAALLKEINDKDDVKDFNLNLFENDMLDSLGIAQLVASMEETFQIEIDPEDILPENFSTINEISALVEKYKR
ncbi:acyl carrier protein [Dialister succinatiphilus]|jgi:acyl carrier protein|uniref:acyl carrier protein n=1 Tax=Dialister succinatiphilus TaxID=487173 RepID=UPI00265E0D89|nr:phosphopantetheine-binding protein [uncultured Dialister sp.]